MVKDIILQQTITDDELQDVVINLQMIRSIGLHLIWDLDTCSYEVVCLTDMLSDWQVLCTTGNLKSITDKNLEAIVRDVHENLVNRDKIARNPWSQRKPRRHVK
nr:LEF-5 [Menippe mercenaria nudivirus]